MAYGALRWHFQLMPLLCSFLDRPSKQSDADLQALLMVGFYQLLHMRVAPHAAVKETVEATVVLKKGWAKAMTNAVLRRLLREELEIRARIDADENHARPSPRPARRRRHCGVCRAGRGQRADAGVAGGG